MKVELLTPLKEPAKIRVTYNDKELFTKDFAAGETPNLEFATPKESGVATAHLIVGTKDISVGYAEYIYDDVLGAQMLIKKAQGLGIDHKNWASRTKLLRAIRILEAQAPESADLAKAYRSIAFAHWYAKCRKHLRQKRQQEALAYYEKAIALYEKTGNFRALSGNLSNISVLYGKAGDKETALARALKGLEVERAHPTPTDDPAYKERAGAWTHAASCYLALGRVDEADAVLKDGFAAIGEDDKNAGWLWLLQAGSYEQRARRCREKADKLLPPRK